MAGRIEVEIEILIRQGADNRVVEPDRGLPAVAVMRVDL